MEIRLYLKCPDNYCNDANYWVCSRCNTDCYLNEFGYVKCRTFKCLDIFIQFVRFNCNRYSHESEKSYYKKSSDFLQCLSFAIGSIEICNKYSQSFLTKFSKSLA